MGSSDLLQFIDFFPRYLFFERFDHRVFLHGEHSLLARHFHYLRLSGSLEDHPFKFLVHLQYFEHRGPAARAFGTIGGRTRREHLFGERDGFLEFFGNVPEFAIDHRPDAPLNGKHCPRFGADELHETLGDREYERRSDEERIDAHVYEARDDADGVVRVDSREHEVACERRLHGKLGGLFFADLADHDDIGVLTEGVPEAGGERIADLGSNLRLTHARYVVFDRVLEREHVVLLAVDLVQHRIERRRFSGASRAGEKNHAIRPRQRRPHESEVALGDTHLAQGFDAFRGVEDTHHDLLTVIGRECRDAEVDPSAFYPRAETPVLRLALLVEAHIREYLDAGDHGRMDLGRQYERCVEHAVHTEPHPHFGAHMFDVDV